jgi:hypothetical protein
MHVERQVICLGNVPRGIRKKEVENLTFPKLKEGMLRQKQWKMGNPS